MHEVLITGATGFVGGALAATLLACGARVVALSRDDPDGMRTVNSVIDAAQGCGLDISGALPSHFNVINIDLAKRGTELGSAELGDVTEVWHVAAEMSYSTQRLVQSFSTNVGNTGLLYEKVCQHAQDCRRFYYVSTAYVAGMDGGHVPEELHPRPRMSNTYQTTKWCAEQSLHLLYRRHGLPVTLFRPTVVVGHRRTGWTRRNAFGFYMFLEAMMAIAKAGQKELMVDLKPDNRVDLIAVDQLVSDAWLLTLREQQGRDFEVFNCSGGCSERMEDLVRMWGEVAGVRAALGAPVTALDQKFDRAVDTNRPFANQEWHFDRNKLDHAIGRTGRPQPLALEELREICTWYAAGSAAERSKVAEAHRGATA